MRCHSNTTEDAGAPPHSDTDGEPKFTILVQSRDGIAMFMIPGLMLTAAALGVGGWRAWRAERRLATGGVARDEPGGGKTGNLT